MTITLLTGAEILTVVDELATLRLTIFEEYPYLYRGERADELAYLRSYAETGDGCAAIARVDGSVVGAATGMPLIHEHDSLRRAVAVSPIPLESIYYVGELLFLPAYRGGGFGQALLARLEEYVRSRKGYRTLACATVERPIDHPQRPTGYIPITRFLARTGFAPLPGGTAFFPWRETDGVVRDHAMQLWLKALVRE